MASVVSKLIDHRHTILDNMNIKPPHKRSVCRAMVLLDFDLIRCFNLTSDALVV